MVDFKFSFVLCIPTYRASVLLLFGFLRHTVRASAGDAGNGSLATSGLSGVLVFCCLLFCYLVICYIVILLSPRGHVCYLWLQGHSIECNICYGKCAFVLL